MKAFRINRYSKTDTLELVEVPAPKINEHEVLVEIYAASINQLDAKLKHGDFKLLLPYKMPLTLGHDVAGVIVQVGSKVKNFQVGDEIYARLPDFSIGGFNPRSHAGSGVKVFPSLFVCAVSIHAPTRGAT